MSGVSIQNFTRRPTAPRAVFSAIARDVLPGWDISLVFVGPARARALNKNLRHKEYVPNVLSYVAGAKSGEIIICLAEARRQAPAHGMSERTFVLYLFIHGALHIKGWAHGATMERSERKLVAKFAPSGARSLPNVTTHRNRHRHRHVPGKNGRRRGTLR
ncbi:MAG: rRNA maturation RNase YbeY [Parcubacteria group bacterium 21-58-10]|nr:MAG: rRNA maturation RNase YbeY [Parcubacteria group bacterium 21-58-10]